MNWSFSFRPKLVDTLKNYSAGTFFPDLTAGLTVGIVALTVAMAFAIASGVKPEAGIFTAVIAGFLISALGGTKVSIGGPTGAWSAQRSHASARVGKLRIVARRASHYSCQWQRKTQLMKPLARKTLLSTAILTAGFSLNREASR